MYEWQIKEMKKKAQRIQTETHEINGVLYWDSNARPVPVDCFEDAGLPVPSRQEQACEDHSNAFFAQYRKDMANHQPSDEELFEMRSAFGEGETVINVVTGQRIQL